MTSSYHEINDPEEISKSFGEGTPSLEHFDQRARKLFDKARNWVGDLSLEGIVTQEGQQVTYVAQDISTKIRLASPTQEVPQSPRTSSNFRRDDTISTTASVSLSDDLNIVMNEVELEAKKLASSVDTLTENLTGILHSVCIHIMLI